MLCWGGEGGGWQGWGTPVVGAPPLCITHPSRGLACTPASQHPSTTNAQPTGIRAALEASDPDHVNIDYWARAQPAAVQRGG